MIYLFEGLDNSASQVFDGRTLTEMQKDEAVTVENLPIAEEIKGKIAILKCRKSTGEVWYEYEDLELTEDEKVDKLRNDMNESIMELTMLIAMGGM